MKNPTRVTVALDEETANLIEKITDDIGLSRSELVRRALRFYGANLINLDSSIIEKLPLQLEMLLHGEHIILDLDHWLLFLSLVEGHPKEDWFWDNCRKIAKSHAEQLGERIDSVESLLARLEACNFFRLIKNSERDFTLLLGSELPKNFIRIFLEEFSTAVGFQIEIREDLSKLRVIVRKRN